MSTRGALGAHRPKAEVRSESPYISSVVVESLLLLQTHERLKAFCGELIAALETLTPAEPENQRFKAPRSQAITAWNSMSQKEMPTILNFVQFLQHTLNAALATQKAPDKAASGAPAAASALSPSAMANRIYAGRRPPTTKRSEAK